MRFAGIQSFVASHLSLPSISELQKQNRHYIVVQIGSKMLFVIHLRIFFLLFAALSEKSLLTDLNEQNTGYQLLRAIKKSLYVVDIDSVGFVP